MFIDFNEPHTLISAGQALRDTIVLLVMYLGVTENDIMICVELNKIIILLKRSCRVHESNEPYMYTTVILN